jgi:hypothetical protein
MRTSLLRLHLVIALFAGAISCSAEERAPIQVLTYNVLYGFNHGKAPQCQEAQ